MSGSKNVDEAKALFSETVLQLSDHREDEIYERLAELVVDLDEDPLLFGPKRLQEKIYHVRKCLDTIEVMSLGASQRQFAASQDFRAKDVAFNLSCKYLYATDTEVRAQRAQVDREAIASVKLKDELAERNLAEAVMQELDAVVAVVKAKKADLKNIQSVLREQLKLCHARIDRGEMWGSAVPGARPISPGRLVSDDVDVDGVLAQVAGEVNLPTIEEEEIPPASDVTPVLESLEIPDADLDGIEDWLDAVEEVEDSLCAPDSEVKEAAPLMEKPPSFSEIELPEGATEEFRFDAEVEADFDSVLADVKAPDRTRRQPQSVAVVVSVDEEVDNLVDLFGD